jgi:hypothetical protein
MTHTKSYAKLIDTVRESGGDVQTMTAFAECVITAYKASLAQRPWVGLTEQELESAYWGYMEVPTQNGFEKTVKALEAKLKEKNT